MFTCCQIRELSFANDTIEICTVKISNENNSLSLCGIYRPHSDTISNFGDSLENLLNHNDLLGTCVLGGDYNINLMSDNSDVLQFVDLMRSRHFIQVIEGVTHPGYNDMSSSCIDHFWTNNLNGYNCGIVETGVTDHNTLFLKLPFNSNKKNCSKTKIEFREYNDVNKLSFEEKIAHFDWNAIESEHVNIFMQNFSSSINKLYTECFPLKTKLVTDRYFRNPWHNSAVKNLSDAREKYHSLYKLDLVSHREYSIYRNRITSLIRKHKENYFQNLFQRNMNNIKNTWKNIKLVCNNSSRKNIESIIWNDTKYTSDKDIAEIFNNFFVNIAKDIEQTLPNSNISPYSAVFPNNSPPIEIHPCTFDEISDIIISLKNTKTDNKHISISIFKCFRNYFIPTL